MALVMPIAGRLTDRFGGGPLALFGVTLCTVATIPFGLIGAHTSIVVAVGRDVRPRRRDRVRLHAGDGRRVRLARRAPSCPTRHRSSTCCSGSAARSAPPCWRSCSSARWSARTRLSGAAGAYGTAFWASAGLAALAIIPCIDPDARRARGAGGPGARRSRPRPRRWRRRSRRECRGREASTGAWRRGRRAPARATPPSTWRDRSSARWPRCAGCAGARRTARASSATRSTACCSACATAVRCRRATSPRPPT